jgi:hypothetical protein
MPVSATIYMALELVLVALSMLSLKTSKNCSKMVKFFSSTQMFLLEANVIEFWFYAALNVTIYPQMSDKTVANTTSFVIALYILLSSIWKYSVAFLKVYTAIGEMNSGTFAQPLREIDLDIALDGLKSKSLIGANNKLMIKKQTEKYPISDKVRYKLMNTVNLNLLFRAQLLFISAALVSGQNFKTLTCFSFIVLEGLTMAYIFNLKSKHGAVFSSWIDFFSYFLIVLIVMILAMMGLSLQEWHTDEYNRVHGITIDNEEFSYSLATILIVLIITSILLEAIKAAIGLLSPASRGNKLSKKEKMENKKVKSGSSSPVNSNQSISQGNTHRVGVGHGDGEIFQAMGMVQGKKKSNKKIKSKAFRKKHSPKTRLKNEKGKKKGSSRVNIKKRKKPVKARADRNLIPTPDSLLVRKRKGVRKSVWRKLRSSSDSMNQLDESVLSKEVGMGRSRKDSSNNKKIPTLQARLNHPSNENSIDQFQ